MVTPASELEMSDAHMQPLGTATVQNTSSHSLVRNHTTLFSSKDSFISNTSSRDPALK